MGVVIAIDGPAAAGKGTLSRQIAETYGFHHLDTGLVEPLLDLLLQMLGHFVGVAAQRHLMLFVSVVLVAGGHVAHR